MNRGEVSQAALARVDQEKLRLAAEVQENWMPHVVGKMSLRPGLQYIGETLNSREALLLDFVKSRDDTAIIELTDSTMRVWKDDALVEREAVSTVVTNGDFSSSTGWTLTATSGASSTISGERLSLHARALGSSALAQRTVTVASGDQNKLHALRIEVERGPVTFRTFSGGISVSYQDSEVFEASVGVASHTFSGVTIGTAAATRRVIVGVYVRRSGAGTSLTGVTVGGVAATLLTNSVIGRTDRALYIAHVPTGTTADIEVSTSSFANYFQIGVWAATGLTSNTPLDVKTSIVDPASATITTQDGGFVIGYCAGMATSGSAAWTNGSERFDALNDATDIHTGADAATSGTSLVLTCDLSGTLQWTGMVAVSFPGEVSQTSDIELKTGIHSIGLVPTGDFNVRFSTTRKTTAVVKSIAVEGEGALTLPTPWTESLLSKVRKTQSGDIVFVACEGVQPRQIERRDNDSWSIVKYENTGGPFSAPPVYEREILLSCDQSSGGTRTITASANLFRPEHVGSLIRIITSGQTFRTDLAGADRYTDAIRVSGVGADNSFTVTRAGTWSGTLTLQRSYDGPDAGFIDTGTTYTTNATSSVSPASGLDNVVHWYRVGFKSGAYTSGVAEVTLTYKGGGYAGIGRIVQYTSPTQVVVDIIKPFSSSDATKDWEKGEWSDIAGWPTCLEFFDGRLFFAGKDRMWGSVSDDFTNFDVEFEGDAGPIVRSIGSGPIARINWLLPLARLIAGREMSESSIRSSSFDEPLTPTQLTIKDCSTQGSAPYPAAKVDKHGIFVQRAGNRLFQLLFSVDQQDYSSRDLTALNTDIGQEGFLTPIVQRQPDPHIWVPREDGECPALLYDPTEEGGENASAWWRLVTDGDIEGGCVLPAVAGDMSYFIVERTINGSTKRFIEKLARPDQCEGQPEARLADCHVMYSGSAVTTITGLDHLEGEEVVVWGWNTSSPFTVTVDGETVTVGRDLGTFTVSGGQITGLSASVTDACIGLGYTAKFKSAKLAYAAAMGTAINQRKRVTKLGFVLQNTHYQAIRHGPSFDRLDTMPLMERGAAIAEHTVWPTYDFDMTEHPGNYDTDSRFCLVATAPKPATVNSVVIGMETRDRS